MDTNESALLRAILEAPADDAHRLIYADCLDERGEPGDAERAELIRLQIKEPGVHRQLEELLLLKYFKEWGVVEPWTLGNGMEGSPVGTNTRRMVFSRGFVDRIECTTAAFIGGPCGRCDGLGRMVHRPDGTHGLVTAPCPTCRGRGRTAGAVEVFRTMPVTGVRLTDRDPCWDGTEPGWVRLPFADAAVLALSTACVAYGRANAPGHTYEARCDRCDGTGWHGCHHCSGSGTVTRRGLPPLEVPKVAGKK